MAEYIEREAAIKLIAEDKVEITPILCAITPTYTAEQAFDGINQACDRHIESIKILPAADVQPVKWITVAERLPEEKGNYLVVFDCGHGAEVHEAFFFKYFDSWEWYDPVEEYEKYNPTHWMPLPEPPTVIESESYSERELQRDYEASVEYAQYCGRYEPTYDPDTGAM